VADLLIADEPHHMGDLAAWGLQTRRVFDGAASGCCSRARPFRSDNRLAMAEKRSMDSNVRGLV
jgi:hypothetical protein